MNRYSIRWNFNPLSWLVLINWHAHKFNVLFGKTYDQSSIPLGNRIKLLIWFVQFNLMKYTAKKRLIYPTKEVPCKIKNFKWVWQNQGRSHLRGPVPPTFWARQGKKHSRAPHFFWTKRVPIVERPPHFQKRDYAPDFGLSRCLKT